MSLVKITTNEEGEREEKTVWPIDNMHKFREKLEEMLLDENGEFTELEYISKDELYDILLDIHDYVILYNIRNPNITRVFENHDEDEDDNLEDEDDKFYAKFHFAKKYELMLIIKNIAEEAGMTTREFDPTYDIRR